MPPEGKPPTLDLAVLDELAAAVAELAHEPPRVAVLCSESPKYFCVGANLEALRRIDVGTIEPWVRRGHEVLNALEDLPLPVIAPVSGYALGGGLELALAADLIYASSDARLGLTEAKLGVVPGWGGSRRLIERVGVARAKQWFYTARMVPADEALSAGLVDHVAEPDALEDALESIVSDILSCSAVAIAGFKSILAEARAPARQVNASSEARHSVACVGDPDTQARLEAFFASRKAK